MKRGVPCAPREICSVAAAAGSDALAVVSAPWPREPVAQMRSLHRGAVRSSELHAGGSMNPGLRLDMAPISRMYRKNGS